LPAIIVTPSSPALDAPEYYIAFLTPPPKPTLRDRVAEYSPFQPQLPLKARTAIIISLAFFIIFCHLLVHLVIRHPHFEFFASSDDIKALEVDYHQPQQSFWDLLGLNFKSFLNGPMAGDKRNFIMEDISQAAHR